MWANGYGYWRYWWSRSCYLLFVRRQLLSQIVIMKPQIDLCWQCQQNSTFILKTINKSVEDKSKYRLHKQCSNMLPLFSLRWSSQQKSTLSWYRQERAHYHECLSTSSTSIKASFPVVPSSGSCFQPAVQMPPFIIAFDVAQQVHTLIVYSCQCTRAETNTKFSIWIVENI